MSVTIKEVAKLAGVSISTVSRVINNSKPVSEDIRLRVLEVIEETKYVPNPVARSLVLRKSNFIGVIVPDISDFKMGDMLNGIEEVGKMYDYDLIVCNSYGEPEEEEKYIKLLLNKQVAGIIFLSWNLTENLVSLVKSSNLPAIYVSKNAKDFDIQSVGVDHHKAGADAARYILEKNFKKVAVIDAVREDSHKKSEVLRGFTEVFDQAKISFDKHQVYYKRNRVQASYEYLAEYIKDGKELPEIFFVTGDDAAAGIINALMDNGINVPNQVSVLGYDNSKISTIVRPKLTTIDQPLYDIGEIAIGVLIKQINGDDAAGGKIIPHSIVERESVK